jgi:hypothetical protein
MSCLMLHVLAGCGRCSVVDEVDVLGILLDNHSTISIYGCVHVCYTSLCTPLIFYVMCSLMQYLQLRFVDVVTEQCKMRSEGKE